MESAMQIIQFFLKLSLIFSFSLCFYTVVFIGFSLLFKIKTIIYAK